MRLQFIVGIGFDSLGVPISPAEVVLHIAQAREHLVQTYGGVTVTRGEGSWKNDHGRIVTEPCVIFDVATTCWEETRQSSAQFLCRLFSQSTVALSVIESVNTFIGGA